MVCSPLHTLFRRQLKRAARPEIVPDTYVQDDVEQRLKEEVLKGFKVRFVASFVVTIFLWLSLPQIHMRCSPIHLISQPAPSPTLPTLRRIAARDNLADFQQEIAFLWGRRELRLRPGRETMNPRLPSTVQHSTPAEGPSSCLS